MIISPHAQGSVDWMIARSGIPTASEFDNLLTPKKMEPKEGKEVKTYLHKKLAEWWMGGPLPCFNSFDMDQGQILEKEALPWYELEYGVTVQRVGLITTDDGRAGCSPDGWLDPGGIEIKCPLIQTHFGYLLDGCLPTDYVPQVHGSMWVTGAPWWMFLSYCRSTPQLVIKVERDEAIQSRISEAVGMFLEKFEAGKRRLCELNGGPPDRQEPTPPTPAPTQPDDLIP